MQDLDNTLHELGELIDIGTERLHNGERISVNENTLRLLRNVYDLLKNGTD